MFIRDIVDSDLENIAHIEAVCSGSEASTLNELKEFFSSKSPMEFFRVLELPQGLLGFIGFSFNEKENEIYIWNLAVLPEYRQKGYARSFLGQVLAEREKLKATKISLKISEKNKIAFGLFDSLGFQVIGKIKNYYSDGSDCLALQLRF